MGIPGTIAGAIVGNSGGRAGDIGQLAASVQVLTQDGEIAIRKGDELSFSYRRSSFQDLLVQLKIPRGDQARDIRLLIGGPVERGRGFVLHSSDYHSAKATMAVGETYGMTTTLDVLEALSVGSGPLQAVMAFGYSGWGAGQLEAEIARNDWLIGDASDGLIFGAEPARKWALALAGMGVDAMALSPSGGRA